MRILTLLISLLWFTIWVNGNTYAGTISWSTNKSGLWSDPGNWNTGTTPDSLDNVFIVKSGNYTITLDLDVTINSLNLGGSGGSQMLTAGGRIFTIDSTSTINARGHLLFTDSNKVLGNGTLINVGELGLENSTINCVLINQGLLTVHGATEFNNEFKNDPGASLIVEGLTGVTAKLVIAESFVNNGFIELTSADPLSSAELLVLEEILVNEIGAEINSAAGAGGGRNLQAHIDNRGAMSVYQTLTIDKEFSSHTNSGSVDLNSGDLLLTMSGNDFSFGNKGIITIGSGRTFRIINGSFENSPGGILQGNGILDVADATFLNAGYVNPGTSPGILNILGDFSQDSGGSVNIEIGGLIGGTEFDRLEVSDNLNAEGNLTVSLMNGFLPAVGDSFNIISFASRSGFFSAVTGMDLSSRRHYELDYQSKKLILRTVLTNMPPVAINDTVSTPEDKPIAVKVLANDFDPDGDTLVVELPDSTGSIGTVVLDPGDSLLTFTPKSNFNGIDRFSYSVRDIFGGSATGTVIISVLPVNDPPVIYGLPDSTEFTGDNSVVLRIWDFVDDPETADSLLMYHFQSTGDSVFWSFDSSGGELTIFADPTFGGKCSIFITVEDDSGAKAIDSLQVIVDPVTAMANGRGYNIPADFVLIQNYPNPFNPVTKIRFGLSENVRVKIEIFNIVGQRVMILLDEHKPAGYYEVDLNAGHLASGVYFYRMQAENFQSIRRMILLK